MAGLLSLPDNLSSKSFRDECFQRPGRSRLFAIEQQQTKVMEELNNLLKARVKDAVHELSEYLNSRDIRVRFTSWN